jgi:hypothetical protein
MQVEYQWQAAARLQLGLPALVSMLLLESMDGQQRLCHCQALCGVHKFFLSDQVTPCPSC